MARPPTRIDLVSKPLQQFLRIEVTGGAVLFLFVVVALVIANTPWGPNLRQLSELSAGLVVEDTIWSRPLKNWVNDGLLTLFFLVVALELKREMVTGELRLLRVAALSLAGACGGMLVPALLYLALQWDAPGQAGWGAVMSTDTAFVIGGLALLGKRAPLSLRVFLLSLVVLDDIGAILIVAVGYSKHIFIPALVAGATAVFAAGVLGWLGLRSILVYTILGAVTWVALDAGGIHPTVTGVLFGLLAPARPVVNNRLLTGVINNLVSFLSDKRPRSVLESRSRLHAAEVAIHENTALTERLGYVLHPWVSFGVMPLFALVNAGVVLSMDELGNPVTQAIAVSLVVGKPAGILFFSWIAVQLRLAERPPDMSWSVLAAGSILAGAGFTMSLLIADLAFEEPLLGAAQLGILIGSFLAMTLGLGALALLSPPRSPAPIEHS